MVTNNLSEAQFNLGANAAYQLWMLESLSLY